MEINRVVALRSVANYAAPYGVKVTPYPIPERLEVIEIITGGKIYFPVDGVEREFGVGTIFWHIHGDATIHSCPPDDPYRCLAMGFSVQESRRVLPRVTRWDDLYAFEDFRRQALKHAHDERIDRSALANMLYHRVFWEAYMHTKREESAGFPASLERAMAIMDRDFGGELSVETAARRAGVSTPHLYSLFKRYLATTPHRYLLNLRLRRARTMLAGNEKSIKEISMACGFANIESFYRAFRKNSRMTPAEYRNVNSLSQ